jgi:hypothetical protein
MKGGEVLREDLCPFGDEAKCKDTKTFPGDGLTSNRRLEGARIRTMSADVSCAFMVSSLEGVPSLY